MPKTKLTFEDNIQQLESIISALEKGEAPLEECMALFEKGVRLSNDCLKMLSDAEQKIKLLTEKEDGTIAEQDFIPKDE